MMDQNQSTFASRTSAPGKSFQLPCSQFSLSQPQAIAKSTAKKNLKPVQKIVFATLRHSIFVEPFIDSTGELRVEEEDKSRNPNKRETKISLWGSHRNVFCPWLCHCRWESDRIGSIPKPGSFPHVEKKGWWSKTRFRSIITKMLLLPVASTKWFCLLNVSSYAFTRYFLPLSLILSQLSLLPLYFLSSASPSQLSPIWLRTFLLFMVDQNQSTFALRTSTSGRSFQLPHLQSSLSQP